ncbi:vitamin K epoxide reductase family protein [Raineyella sp. LH-20]|uniref:vitamin K epoxide reductase family protein n=1 Tax=Raineyella sp. LH-20 TaxID=3081204 RepID=UPI002952CCE9|nr:vitamin K epoxide reductase family protein [Raineyella sp. LH-20]WOP18663.1 vitamin K epoxide reductase family protein [Raineyella sp. LH-20]
MSETRTDEPISRAEIRRAEPGRQVLFVTMLVSAALSLLASFVLSADAVRLAADPHVALSCNINATISCGTVGTSWQASLFGFPNAFLGLIAEPVVITLAVAGLAGVRFPRGFMLAAQVVYLLGFLFAYWLFFEAVFDIGALCPWCLLVTLSTTGVFASMTRLNILDNSLYLPTRVQARLLRGLRWGLDRLIVGLWLVALVIVIVVHYGAALVA